MNPLLIEFLGVVVRWLITSVGAYLVGHHVLTADQEGRFADGAVRYLLEHAVLWSPLVGGLVLGLWSKYRSRIKFLTALQAAPGTTEYQVNARIENGLGASVKAGVILLACVLVAGAIACGPKQYHTAVVANTSIAQAIFAVQDAETDAHNAGLIDADHHAKYKAEILRLLEAGDDLTLALKDWNPSQPVPANVGLAIGHVQLLLTDLQVHSPQLDKVIFAVQTVLSVLRGSGVLPSDAGGDTTQFRQVGFRQIAIFDARVIKVVAAFAACDERDVLTQQSLMVNECPSNKCPRQLVQSGLEVTVHLVCRDCTARAVRDRALERFAERRVVLFTHAAILHLEAA